MTVPVALGVETELARGHRDRVGGVHLALSEWLDAMTSFTRASSSVPRSRVSSSR
jgi:hypothetical protein